MHRTPSRRPLTRGGHTLFLLPSLPGSWPCLIFLPSFVPSARKCLVTHSLADLRPPLHLANKLAVPPPQCRWPPGTGVFTRDPSVPAVCQAEALTSTPRPSPRHVAAITVAPAIDSVPFKQCTLTKPPMLSSPSQIAKSLCAS